MGAASLGESRSRTGPLSSPSTRTLGYGRPVGVALIGMGLGAKKMLNVLGAAPRTPRRSRRRANLETARTLCDEKGVALTAITRMRSPIRRSKRSFWRRRTRCMANRSRPQSGRGSTCFARSRWP